MPKKGGILALIRQAQGLNPNPEEESALKKLSPHVPGIVTFADHNKALPWSSTYSTVLMFADISGFTALCECYSAMQNKGIDQLTKTLNDYLGAIVDGIVTSEGDVLKFAGDAILAVWRVNESSELSTAVSKVVKCCLGIQSKCGEWKTDIGVTLTVKMGVASGDMSVTFLGNNEFRVYVELGKAVSDVNAAEHFCQSGYVVLSPDAWELLQQEPSRWEHEIMEDGCHVRVLSERIQSLKSTYWNLPSKGLFGRKKNAIALSFITKTTVLSKSPSKDEQKKMDLLSVTQKLLPGKTSVTNIPTAKPSIASILPAKPSIANLRQAKPSIASILPIKPPTVKEPETDIKDDSASTSVQEEKKSPRIVVTKPGKTGFGGMAKLRDVVKKVTEMRLDEALRLYVLPPVLKKLDDGQPLEYLSEMRQVSIVFMNMVLDEGMDATILLQRIFEVVYSHSKTMHGCLNKVFLFDKGCSFLVIFGLPGYKHERDCAHALICSYRMYNILKVLKGVNRVSIGVTTGTTFCGVVGHTNRHEYSVIGRKVNMAARLMMHYPDKVTCDDETFQWSRLPATHFEVLAAKRMKGLRNIGIIREFFDVADSTSSNVYSVPRFQYPLLGRDKEIRMFLQEINQLQEVRKEDMRNHIVFVGASGIGKTRLLDNLITRAEEQNFRVISSALRLNDACNPYKLTRHIVRMLLSTTGYSHHVNKEPVIMGVIRFKQLANSLYLLNDILDTQFVNPNIGCKIEEEDALRLQLLHIIVQKCVDKLGTVIIAVDDAQNIDTESWIFISDLSNFHQIFLLFTVRPNAIETPPCPAASEFFENSNVIVQDMGGLEAKFICGLACQLMDVVRIPKELEKYFALCFISRYVNTVTVVKKKLLRERFHGVPSWCEQLLIDMANNKQIFIVYNEGRNLQLVANTIAPKPEQISQLNHVTEENVEESKRKKSFFITTNIDFTSGETADTFLTDLGYVHTKPPVTKIKSSKQDRIAIFAPDINPDDITTPPSMKDLIIARLDSMRASDQLVVKCAAVLGQRFTRDMLETILPKVQRVKARKSFKRLSDTGIFECASTPSKRYMNTALQHGRPSFPREGCFCSRVDIGIGENVCDNMKFKNQLLRQTSYEILMESQRKELHEKAAMYLERDADIVRHGIPYYVLERQPPENMTECEVKVSVKAPFGISNKVRDVPESDTSVNKQLRLKKRRRAIVNPKEDLGPIVRVLLESTMSGNATQSLLDHLLPLYKDILHHWKAAKEHRRVINLMLEAIAVALALKKAPRANELIEEVQTIFESVKDEFSKDSSIVLQAKIARFKAKMHYLSGDLKIACSFINEALSLLGLKRGGIYQLHNLRLKLFMIRSSSKTRRPSSERTFEQGYCLQDLYQIDKERGDTSAMRINALQQFAKVSGRGCRLHQFITAYAAMIECYQNNAPFRRQLETELFASCAARYEELSQNDLYTVAKLYADTSIVSMDKGELVRSRTTGNGAAEIGDKLNDHSLEEMFGPKLSMAHILTGRDKECITFLHKFRTRAGKNGNMVSLAWFHSISLEMILDGGFPLESYQSSLAFATHYMRFADAVSGEFISRYFLAMSIAVWHSRKKNWKQAQTWFNYWETYEDPLPCSFLYGHARARKIEVMLLSYCCSRGQKTKKQLQKSEKYILEEFKVLDLLRQQIRSIKPRLYHMKAYYCMLRKKTTSAYTYLYQAIRSSKGQNNDLELRWARHHLRLWFSGSKEDDLWNKCTDQHIVDWRLAAGPCRKLPLYTLPLV